MCNDPSKTDVEIITVECISTHARAHTHFCCGQLCTHASNHCLSVPQKVKERRICSPYAARPAPCCVRHACAHARPCRRVAVLTGRLGRPVICGEEDNVSLIATAVKKHRNKARPGASFRRAACRRAASAQSRSAVHARARLHGIKRGGIRGMWDGSVRKHDSVDAVQERDK